MTNAQRHHTQEIAQIEVYGRMGNLLAKMRNLSVTGAFLELTHADFVPQKGDLLRVTVNLNSVKRTHQLNALVVWTRDLGLGVQFISEEQVLSGMMNRL